MRVDVDSLAFGLLQRLAQVRQIVPRDQNAFSLDRRDADLRRLPLARKILIQFKVPGGFQQAASPRSAGNHKSFGH